MSILPYAAELLTSADTAIQQRAQVRRWVGDTGDPDPMNPANYTFEDEEIDLFIATNINNPCLAAVDLMRSPGNAVKLAMSATYTKTIGRTSVSQGSVQGLQYIFQYAAQLEARCRSRLALTGLRMAGADPRTQPISPIFERGQFDNPSAPSDFPADPDRSPGSLPPPNTDIA